MEIKYSIIIFLLFFCSNLVSAGTELVPAAPKIRASSYLLIDFNSDRLLVSENTEQKLAPVLVSENSEQKLAPASLTKMMTVYVVASELADGKISLDEEVLVSKKAWKMPGSRMFIEVNKKVSVADLLKGVIIQSGNDASVALAEYIAGSEDVFAQMMNQHAQRLGLKHTHYMNSTGLPDEQHYTTAYDLALLAKALIRDFQDIYDLHAVKKFTFNGITQSNRNKLLWSDKSVDGIKTGHTEEAGFCLVASAKRNDMRLISVVLGTDSEKTREMASQALTNYGFRFYETKKLYSMGDIVTSARIWKGETDNVDLGVSRDLYITIPRGQFRNLNAVFDLPETIIAPIIQGEKQGKMKLILSDREILNEFLVALHDVNEASLFDRLKDDIRLIFE
ncbi:MAG: D-alanyl-D-alanine carboxypeptidase family protein [Gammaproteobacteria bacterium]